MIITAGNLRVSIILEAHRGTVWATHYMSPNGDKPCAGYLTQSHQALQLLKLDNK